MGRLIGNHERRALERERDELLQKDNKSQMEARRLDDIESLLRPASLKPESPSGVGKP